MERGEGKGFLRQVDGGLGKSGREGGHFLVFGKIGKTGIYLGGTGIVNGFIGFQG